MLHNLHRKKIYRLFVILLILISAWQWSQAIIIYGKAHLAKWLIASAWQHTLASGQKTKPWPWADTWPVAKIQFNQSATQNTTFFILSGSTGNSLAFGPGHSVETALPATEGASVIGGHRDTHFALLKDMHHGAVISVQNIQGQWKQYRVDTFWVADSQLSPLYINPQENSLYLITCYPFNHIDPNGTERFIVKAISNNS